MTKLRIGSRGSRLALEQAEIVKSRILAFDGKLEIEIIPVKTTGDKILDENLQLIGGKALFTKELDEGLLNNEFELVVHSMKDVTHYVPSGLEIKAILEREDERDVFISQNYKLKDFPFDGIFGTASSRRKAIMTSFGHKNFSLLRGNVETRISKIKNGAYDATMLALAGLKRIGADYSKYEILDKKTSIPAIGQGAIGIVARVGQNFADLLDFINHQDSFIAVGAERILLEIFEADCSTPIACNVSFIDDEAEISAMIARKDFSEIKTEFLKVPKDELFPSARKLALELKEWFND